MRKTKLFGLLGVALLLPGCSKVDFEHLSLDVENIKINLPEKPNYGGAIKTDGTYDFIDIYESSDFHGAVNYSTDDRTIGITKLASYFNKKRETNPGGTVIVSSGDMWQGTAESNLTRGYLMTYSMSYMGFDSMTLGNHEFDWTTDWISKNGKIADFPILCANLVDKSTNKMPDFVKASTLITRGDYKIGIVGTIGAGIEGSILASAVANYEFASEGPIVQSEAAKLREQGADIVIWTAHNDAKSLGTIYGSPKALGVDAVFGGHTHKSSSDINEGVVYQETENNGRAIAHIQLKINKSTKEVSSATEASVVDEEPYNMAGLTDEAGVKSIYDQYNKHIDPIKKMKIGKTDAKLLINSTLGNLAVKSMSERANNWASNNGKDYTGCMAVTNLNGGIRNDINEGKITYGDVYRSFPFDNELVFVKMSGEDFRAKLAARSFNSLGVWKTFETYKDIDKSKDYYVITTDYVATSPNFAFNADENEIVHTGMSLRDVVAEFIYTAKKIKTADFDSSTHKEFGW